MHNNPTGVHKIQVKVVLLIEIVWPPIHYEYPVLPFLSLIVVRDVFILFLFIDEMPWTETRMSRFLEAFTMFFGNGFENREM